MRLYELDDFLCQHDWLWREQPFKNPRPDWCLQLPGLTQCLLNLADTDVKRLERNHEALLELLIPFIPSLQSLVSLCHLKKVATPLAVLSESRFGWEVPGRKLAQISAFSQVISQVNSPLLEWCGGKGHLGRSLALLWQSPVETVEWDQALCDEGKRLSTRVGTVHTFHVENAMDNATVLRTRDKHVVALHACGDLHRQLIHAAGQHRLTGLDLSPCCYHLGRKDTYRAFNDSLRLRLSRDDLRLAVTNSDTAPASQLKLRNQEMAWKLAYDCLRRQLQPDGGYQNIRPIPKAWLRQGFENFCLKLAQRQGLSLPKDIDWISLQAQGWQRQHEVMRLDLPRFAFRRAIEVWLVLDMATYLEQQGYQVQVNEYCTRSVTPRNILISAR